MKYIACLAQEESVLHMESKNFKCVVLSDTHCLHRKVEVPDGDILIHSGDFTSVGRKKEIKDFNNWFSSFPHKYKICIAGNHDILFETQPDVAEALLGDDIIYLKNSFIEIEGIKIWGSPMTPSFGSWAFTRPRGKDIRRIWDNIPEDTDILVTHGPPYGILDMTLEYKAAGCEELSYAILRVQPKYHIFGHIHEGYGVEVRGNTTFINCSVVTRSYSVKNHPISFSIWTHNARHSS